MHHKLGLGVGSAAQGWASRLLVEGGNRVFEDADHPVREGCDAHEVEVHAKFILPVNGWEH